MGKYDEARAAIQDAEKHDEGNEGVWVQVRKLSIKISLSKSRYSSVCTLLR